MLNLVTIIVGAFTLIVTSVLLPMIHVQSTVPNVVVIFVAYAALKRDAYAALVCAFFLGLLAGVLAGGARGAVLLALLPVVAASAWGRHRLQLAQVWALGAWAALMSVFFDTAMVLLLALFQTDTPVWAAYKNNLAVGALATAIFCIPVVGLLGKIEPLLQARQERAGLVR